MVFPTPRYIPGKRNMLANQSSGSGSSSQVVASSLGVQHHLQGVRSSSHRPLHPQDEYKTVLVCVCHSRSHGVEGGCFPTQLRQPKCSFHAFSSFALLRQVLSRVTLTESLYDPCSSSVATKEWFADLLVLVEVPQELPMLWNLLLQPHFRKFHRGFGVTESLCLETIKRLVHKAG